MLSDVFAALPGAYLLLTPELRIVAVSDAYLTDSGMSRAHLIDQYLLDVFPGPPGTPEGNTITSLLASLQQVLATGQFHRMAVQHYSLPHPTVPGDMVEHYWEAHNTPVRDAHGAVTGIVHSVVDVTERIRAEAQVREREVREQAALSAAENQRVSLLHLIEQTPAGVGILQGPEFVVEQADTVLGLIWGRSPAHIIGRPFFEALPDLQEHGF
ncbi:PAS fold-containing protein [Hymenobacter mucosus]|uniref:PAS fold-containing protein n=2 Tax=Hymenobacter mucosus TaxID=1411120 RepID=A0A238Z733_9BACT|nr:PAS fold-containing protein [Hymenobacter mucosus]